MSRLSFVAALLVTLLIVISSAWSVLGFANDSFMTPGTLPVSGAVTQPFGCTWLQLEPFDLSCKSRHFHSGVDIAAPLGTPIRAALAGVAAVIDVAWGYGLHITVDSGDGVSEIYGHLSKCLVSTGDRVEPGEVIGWVGSSGNSTGPHLHFEIRIQGQPQDPLAFLNMAPTNQPNT
jgi:murein DD-endopeptidase MepM/ murein hydrolase activator NlpD